MTAVEERLTLRNAVALDPVTTVTVAAADLEADLDGLLEACTSPDASDMAELLLQITEARETLQRIERETVTALGRVMLADQYDAGGLRIERSRGSDRKAWDHQAWRRDVTNQLLRKHDLLGVQGLVNAAGEVVDAKGVLGGLVAEAYAVQGSKEPTTTGLRGLGLDPRDYCETSPGRVTVKVTRLVDETEG